MANRKLYLITLCTLFGIIYGQNAMCIDGGPPGRMPNGNQFCTQYNSKSCCPTQVTFGKSNGGLLCNTDDGCGGGSFGTCASMLYDLFCAKSCDSQINQFSVPLIAGRGRNYTLCQSWATQVATNCAGYQNCNTTRVGPFPGVPQDCLADNSICVSTFVDVNGAPLTGNTLITSPAGVLFASPFSFGNVLSGRDACNIATGTSPSCFNGPNT